MKKLVVLLSLAVMLVMPLNVNAASWSEEKVLSKNSIYGELSAREMPWEGNDPTQLEVYITKASEYISLTFTVNNLKDVKFMEAANITVVNSDFKDNVLTVLLKTKDGKAITKKTEVGSAMGYPIDTEKGCSIAVTPQTLACAKLDNMYFDKSGKAITEEEYNEVCSNITTEPGDDVQTGSVIPYVAIAGGLIAIAGVYLYSRRTNKMYKL